MTWLSGLSDVALAYGLPEAEIEQRMYTLAEQLHQHYCLQRGIVNHNEARPDQHVALSMLAALVATDWFMVHGDERRPVYVPPIFEDGPGDDEEAIRLASTGYHDL